MGQPMSIVSGRLTEIISVVRTGGRTRVAPRTTDSVDHPRHYVDVVPGIECISVVEHFSFLRGNALKYLWRGGLKGDPIEDLLKARWYIDREIANLRAERSRLAEIDTSEQAMSA